MVSICRSLPQVGSNIPEQQNRYEGFAGACVEEGDDLLTRKEAIQGMHAMKEEQDRRFECVKWRVGIIYQRQSTDEVCAQ